MKNKNIMMNYQMKNFDHLEDTRSKKARQYDDLPFDLRFRMNCFQQLIDRYQKF